MPDVTRAAGPIHLTDATLSAFLASAELPVLVDVYADWCGPCRLMSPIVDRLAAELEGRAIVAKLDADANPLSVLALGVRGIPTIVVFSRGREVDRQVGMATRGRLVSMIDAAAAKDAVRSA